MKGLSLWRNNFENQQVIEHTIIIKKVNRIKDRNNYRIESGTSKLCSMDDSNDIWLEVRDNS